MKLLVDDFTKRTNIKVNLKNGEDSELGPCSSVRVLPLR